MSEEDLTMSQRIDAFYRQSGGPGSPEIQRVLDEHLKNGKDHGIPGRREELKDAFSEIFLNDHSTRPVVMGLMRIGMEIKKEWGFYLNAKGPDVNEIVDELERRQKKKEEN